MKIFGWNISRAEEVPFKVYNNDCQYCPNWEYKHSSDLGLDMLFGYCKELGQLTNNKMKDCKYKV